MGESCHSFIQGDNAGLGVGTDDQVTFPVAHLAAFASWKLAPGFKVATLVVPGGREVRSIGIREFRDQATQLMASGETLIVERHGEPIGFFVPIVAVDREAGADALGLGWDGPSIR